MNAEFLHEAISELPEELVAGSFMLPEAGNRRRFHLRRHKLLTATAAALLAICPLPALTAFGVEPAYQLLYMIAPPVAQGFKPVRKTCTDQGIELSVISAEITGSKVRCYLALRDTEHRYADALGMDLFDFSLPYDCTGYCNYSSYDEENDTSYFIAGMERIDGKPVTGGKITFRLRDVLYGRQRFKDVLPDVDLSEIPKNPAVRDTFPGAEYSYQAEQDPALKPAHLLVPSQKIPTPVEGTFITALGYIDGALHIQTCYENFDFIGKNGFFGVWLQDENGEIPRLNERDWQEVLFPDAAYTAQYREYIFRVPYEDIAKYQVIGDIYKTEGTVSGKWEITFRGA